MVAGKASAEHSPWDTAYFRSNDPRDERASRVDPQHPDRLAMSEYAM